MRLHPLIIGVGLLATANALLVPPNVPASNGLITTLPVPIDVDADTDDAFVVQSKSWSVNMECPGCPLSNFKHRTDIPSRLKLDFKIKSNQGADRLTVNGYELYPNPDPIHHAFTAPVLPEAGIGHMGLTSSPHFRTGRLSMLGPVPKSQPLGFAMGSQTVATDDDDDLELIIIEIQIFEVGNVFVDRLPRARVSLVKTLSGKLGIGSVKIIAFSPGNPIAEQKECSNALCKWKTLVSEKISSVLSGMGCRGRRPGLPHAHAHANGAHHGHGAHPHRMSHKHKIIRVLMAVITHILLPVLLGLAAGISIGIIITTVIAFSVMIWGALFRRSDRPQNLNPRRFFEAHKEEDGVAVEKAGLLEAQEEVAAPPPYEEKKPENAV
ncbi:hypothetical protein F4861DRAFT_330774 [Xylaria intraflava]|nr:hypothetical protein F4861DRAFT_330774 [Xylaria intraflava]